MLGPPLLWRNRGRRVALDAARGLAYLHSCGVIHRWALQKRWQIPCRQSAARGRTWLVGVFTQMAGSGESDWVSERLTAEPLLRPTLQGREDQQHTAGRLGARQGGGRGPGLSPAHRGHGAGRDGGHLCECRRHHRLTPQHASTSEACDDSVVAAHDAHLKSSTSCKLLACLSTQL